MEYPAGIFVQAANSNVDNVSNVSGSMSDVEARLAAVEDHLGSVSKLAAATARGQGKERTGRLVVVFSTGGFKERVLEILRQWAGAAAFKNAEGGEGGEGGRGSAASSGAGEGRPPPLKYQLYQAMVEQLATQGLGEPVLTTLRATPGSAIESTTAKLPENIGDGAFIFTLLFQPNLEGLAARAALQSTAARQAVQKKGSIWPECGISLPGSPPESFTERFFSFKDTRRRTKWGTSKERRDGSNAAPGKRAASPRLSVSAKAGPFNCNWSCLW